MSADAFIAFFGVRYEITIDESEDENDPRIETARKAGLQYYSGNFGGLAENYFLFVGTRLGGLGAENENEVIVPFQQMQNIITSTCEKLHLAGFRESAALYL